MSRFDSSLVASAFALCVIACSSEETGPGGVLPNDPGNAGQSSQAGNGALAGTAGSSSGVGGNSNGGSGIAFGGMPAAGGVTDLGGSGGSCASESAEAKVTPVYLAFAFDVSGSMGQGDRAWHDRALKWDPVVAATKAFFQDTASDGLSASMTFFPAASDRCEDVSYLMPDVAMTALPSTEFGRVLDERGSQTWRGGTPTLHVLRGVVDFVQDRMQQTPGRYVIVLVSDGYPEGCDDTSIASVVEVARGVAATIPTYVVGVKNPPIDGAPDAVTNLTEIAQAGGTERAYIIDTGNPAQTTTDFKATIDAIRGSAISCNLGIPAPPDGRQFDSEKVAVNYRSGSTTTPLTYDPTCVMPNAWQYDDPLNPTEIELCPSACSTIQVDPVASLSVEFTCETRINIPR